jgi:hypothetical protein
MTPVVFEPTIAAGQRPGAANWHNTQAIYQVSLVQRLLKIASNARNM